jgi:hypothetical protein
MNLFNIVVKYNSFIVLIVREFLNKVTIPTEIVENATTIKLYLLMRFIHMWDRALQWFYLWKKIVLCLTRELTR